MSKYVVDKDFNLRKVTNSVGGILMTSLKWLIATLSMAAFYYLCFSLLISTDEEKKLKRENRMYEKLYPEMQEKERLIADVVRGLEARDNTIYEKLFNADAPEMDPLGRMSFTFGDDSIPDSDIVRYSEGRIASLSAAAAGIESGFLEVFDDISSRKGALPPMIVPVAGLKPAQVGASIGQKINPFYKVISQHDGIDLIVGQGTPVIAAADGTVTDVRRSGKGLGNVVEITHDGGYVTVYAHLEDIVVRKGERVKAGKKLAGVGISGNSFAPHLHYEVRRDGEVLDPVNFFFASFSPEEYTRAAYLAATTGQSMD